MIDLTIIEQIQCSTLRIIARGPSTSVGTGFFFNYTQGDHTIPLLVTNRHVLSGAEQLLSEFPLTSDGATRDGRFTLSVEDAQALCFYHPNPNVDVVVFPCNGLFNHIRERTGKAVLWKAPDQSLVPNPAQERELDSLEEVFFIGYPNGIIDQSNLWPITRRGVTATPVYLDYQGEPKFLIDAAVFGGSSGSPVYLYQRGTIHDRQGNITLGGQRLFLLGIVSSVFFRENDYEIVERTIPTAETFVKTRDMLNLGVVFKSSTIIETIKHHLHVWLPSPPVK